MASWPSAITGAVMRVNPQYVTNLVGALDNTTATIQGLTQELSSGVRLNSLSDDPGAAGQNVRLNAQLSQDVTFSQTASLTEGMLQVSDSAIGDVVRQLTSAISLATSANNGTLSASDLTSISQQLAGIRGQVLSLANTTYLGQYVFAGSQGNSQPFALDSSTSPATVTYQGDSDVRSLQTPNGQIIQLNVPGDQMFTAAGHDVLNTLNQLIADFASGVPSATAQADAAKLTDVLHFVSQQRVQIDNSLNRLQAAGNYAQIESTQLQASQTTLIQADVAMIATQLSSAKAQETALTQVMAQLGKGSLFDYL
jgi:flagellar hook-associated protein 3 FlgL